MPEPVLARRCLNGWGRWTGCKTDRGDIGYEVDGHALLRSYLLHLPLHTQKPQLVKMLANQAFAEPALANVLGMTV